MTHLGEMLLKKKKECPDEELVLFKSDISDAYGSLFITFNLLVTWIGKKVCRIPALGTYSDDSFGVELARNVTFYEPYSWTMLSSQVTLLKLWYRLGIPHKEKKQVFWANLTIIGIDVDANKLTLTLPSKNKLELISLQNNFTRMLEKSGVRYSLRDFQHLAGWFNWALNVYPLLKPVLSNIYTKMGHSKPDKPLTKLYVNNSIRSDLQWAVHHLNRLPGTRVLQSLDWDPDSADLVAYCDASINGLGFWFPGLSAGFWSTIPEDPPKNTIFYFEALSILLSTIADALSHGELHTIVDNIPGIVIDLFSPPQIRRESGAESL